MIMRDKALIEILRIMKKYDINIADLHKNGAV